MDTGELLRLNYNGLYLYDIMNDESRRYGQRIT